MFSKMSMSLKTKAMEMSEILKRLKMQKRPDN